MNKSDTYDFNKSMIIEFMSHQLRTSLNTILGFSDLQNRKSLSEKSKKSYNEYVYHSSLSLLLLYNNLLDLIDQGSESCVVTKEKCHLPGLMEELYKKYSNEMEKRNQKNIQLELRLPELPRHNLILTDEKKLKRIMENLIENAIGFSQEGIVEFGYEAESSQGLRFYVKDHGVGFSLEKLESLFQLFISKKTTLDVSFDLGALRAIVAKQFAGLIGGNLQSDSVLTKGSTYYFVLPAVEEEKVKTKHSHDQSGENKDWTGSKILIAEDVETNFRLLEEFLIPTGIDVSWAKNGKEAVEMFKEPGNFDLILMDIIMPEMDGFEAAARIREINKDVPIIAQTAFSPDDGDTDAQVKNFNEFLIKPIWWRDLANSLSKYLD